MIAVEDRQITSAWSNSLRMLIVLLSMAAFISLFRLADMTALQRHGSVPPRAQAALPAAPPHGMKVVIGKEVLTVPAAAMRFAPNAGNGAAGAGTPPETQLVELNLSWPALEPLAPCQRGIYLSLSARADPIQPRERFQRILMPFFEREVLNGPDGLAGRRLSEGSGYGGEILYFEPRLAMPGAANSLFYARCPAPEFESAPVSCLRTLRLGAGLQATYRFDAALLAQWRRIDSAVSGLIGRMRAR